MHSSDLAWTGEFLWAVSEGPTVLLRIAALSGETESRSVPGVSAARGIAWDGAYLWLTEGANNAAVHRVNAITGEIVQSVPCPPASSCMCEGLEFVDGFLWYMDSDGQVFQTPVGADPAAAPGPEWTKILDLDGLRGRIPAIHWAHICSRPFEEPVSAATNAGSAVWIWGRCWQVQKPKYYY